MTVRLTSRLIIDFVMMVFMLLRGMVIRLIHTTAAYWDPERPAILFFMVNFSILGIYVFNVLWPQITCIHKGQKNRIKEGG
ncbi:hypothetical protein Holit_01038 [Hollandina sp. SP2]